MNHNSNPDNDLAKINGNNLYINIYIIIYCVYSVKSNKFRCTVNPTRASSIKPQLPRKNGFKCICKG